MRKQISKDSFIGVNGASAEFESNKTLLSKEPLEGPNLMKQETSIDTYNKKQMKNDQGQNSGHNARSQDGSGSFNSITGNQHGGQNITSGPSNGYKAQGNAIKQHKMGNSITGNQHGGQNITSGPSDGYKAQGNAIKQHKMGNGITGNQHGSQDITSGPSNGYKAQGNAIKQHKMGNSITGNQHGSQDITSGPVNESSNQRNAITQQATGSSLASNQQESQETASVTSKESNEPTNQNDVVTNYDKKQDPENIEQGQATCNGPHCSGTRTNQDEIQNTSNSKKCSGGDIACFCLNVTKVAPEILEGIQKYRVPITENTL
jgi:hypothetical protein